MSIADLGGLFAIATFVHFIFDWLTQSEADAMVKHKNWLIRAKHCHIYAALMAGFLVVVGNDHSLGMLLSLWAWLFITHFLEDTYWFPSWWLRRVRKTNGPIEDLNLILLIVVDQLVHLAALLVACWMVLV